MKCIRVPNLAKTPKSPKSGIAEKNILLSIEVQSVFGFGHKKCQFGAWAFLEGANWGASAKLALLALKIKSWRRGAKLLQTHLMNPEKITPNKFKHWSYTPCPAFIRHRGATHPLNSCAQLNRFCKQHSK